jgi:hypothetical protein
VFKRVIWIGTGAAVGASSAFWVKRKLQRTVEHYLPDQVAQRAGASARNLGRTVRDAATEGRAAMRQREAELRAERDVHTLGSRAMGEAAHHYSVGRAGQAPPR